MGNTGAAKTIAQMRSRVARNGRSSPADLHAGNSAFPGSPPGTGRVVRGEALDRYLASQTTAGANAPKPARAGGAKGTAQPRAAKAPAGKPTPKTMAKAPKETIHERSARLQREQGLRAEVRPGRALNPINVSAGGIGFNPGDRISVSGIRAAFGEHQVGTALHLYSHDKLRTAARELGVAPGRSKAETVSRITSHVTQGRYSANFKATTANKAATLRTGAPSARAKKPAAGGTDVIRQATHAVHTVQGALHRVMPGA